MPPPATPAALRWHWKALIWSGVALAFLGALSLVRPRADWLTVEAPEMAILGQPLQLRVQLRARPESGFVRTALHWRGRWLEPRGNLSLAQAQAVRSDNGTYVFDVPVPSRDGVRQVHGVIFLSRTGTWQDRTRVAFTESLPVRSSSPGQPTERRRSLAVYEPEKRLPPVDVSRTARWITALVFATATIAAAQPKTTRRTRPTPWRVVLVGSLALITLAELLALEEVVARWIRESARAQQLYYFRETLQKTVTALALTGALAWIVQSLRSPPRGVSGIALACLLATAALSLSTMLSLHAIDTLNPALLPGWPLVQGLKLMLGLTACVECARPWRSLRQ